MPHWLDKIIVLLQADTSDLRKLASIVGADPKIFYRGIRLADLDVGGQDIEDMEFADRRVGGNDSDSNWRLIIDGDNKPISAIKAARKTHKIGRQEERMAILLDLILRNPNDALLIINLYSEDRAKYANLVLMQIETEILSSRQEASLVKEERSIRLSGAVLARILNGTFSRGIPNNRAALLYYMAKHLSNYPDINRYLRDKITKSRSSFVIPHRREIIDFLDQGDENSIGNQTS